MCAAYAVMPVEFNGKIKCIRSIKYSYNTTAIESQAIVANHKVSLNKVFVLWHCTFKFNCGLLQNYPKVSEFHPNILFICFIKIH